MKPPMKYPNARVIADVHAWLTLGSVSRWWKDMMNSSILSGEL